MEMASCEEPYDIAKDPCQIKLSERLMKLLTDAKDPRVTSDGKTVERSPFTDAGPNPQEKAKAKEEKRKRKLI